MNKEWSEYMKSIQLGCKKEETFGDAIQTLLVLRDCLMESMKGWRDLVSFEDFAAQPYINVTGYHNKTLAYSMWHVARIEDIVVHTIMKKDDEIFFAGDYQKRMNAPIITTGNELYREAIADFSAKLDIDVLYTYFEEVKSSTDAFLKTLTYKESKQKVEDAARERIKHLQVVSTDDCAIWLTDYWCNKKWGGLLLMPLSRHWIMHVDAGNRILEKLSRRK